MTQALANERLQKRFKAWDVNGDGLLEREDVEKEAVIIAQAFGKDVAAPEVATLKNAFLGLYDYLANAAGGVTQGIDQDTFVRISENLIYEQGEAAVHRVLGPVIEGIVGICDKNGDRLINRAEFADWLNAVGVDRSHAEDAFQKVDKIGNGELTVDELLAAVRDFHFGRLDVELLG
jgi:Ca2+-binding EF-hand superfamily protein